MKLLVDVNLSPEWVSFLTERGWDAVHWSKIGKHSAPDTEIMKWAREYGHVIFTHDLDFGALLALTRAEGPSVVQVRTQDITPAAIGELVERSFRQLEAQLENGALVIIDETRLRARVLPLSR